MAFLFLKRVFSDLDKQQINLRRTRHVETALFAVTYGLWLLTSLAGLVFAITDALPSSGQVLLVNQILE
jgi:hypothetical protein